MSAARPFTALLVVLMLGVAAVSSLALPAWADSPTLSVGLSPKRGPVEERFTLEVTVTGSPQVGRPEFENSSQFAIEAAGTSTKRQIINGREQFQVSFLFEVVPDRGLRPGTYYLPRGELSIGGEQYEILPQKLTVIRSGAQQGRSSASGQPSDVAFVHHVNKQKPFVGEQILYKVEIAANRNFLGGNLEEIEPAGFYRENLGDKERSERTSGSITVRTFTEVLIPTKAGQLELPERTLVAKVRKPLPRMQRRSRDPFEAFFEGDPFTSFLERHRTTTKKLVAPPVALEVRPLPPPPGGHSGYIPVGLIDVELTAKPQRIELGESVTLIIEVWGTANLRPLELPELPHSSDFRFYPEKPAVDAAYKDGTLYYSKAFQVALVPQRTGTLNVPPFSFLFFNPETEQYDRRTTEGVTIEVVPSKSGQEELQMVGNEEQLKTLEATEAPPAPDVSEPTPEQTGLRPLRTGPASLRKPLPTPDLPLLAIVLTLPIVSLTIMLVLRRRAARLADVAGERSRTAAERAMNALNELERSVPDPQQANAVIRQTLYRYLEERLQRKLESLTAQETAAALEPDIPDHKLAEDLSRQLGELEHTLYAGPLAEGDPVEPRLEEARRLVEQLENNFRARK